MNEIVKLAPSRLPIASAIAKEFDLTPDKWRVLVEQIFPAAKSVESVTMALSYCRARNLDIYKKPVHIVPMWSSTLNRMVETVWPGISEIRTTAARTGEYAGIDAVEFGPMVDRKFTGQGKHGEIEKSVRFPEWASVIVYRIVQGERCAYHAKVFWEETYAAIGKTDVPNDMWAKRPRGQLDKCVEAAALRKAFPEELGNTYAAEEMEGRVLDHGELRDVTPPMPPKAPPPPADLKVTPPTPPKPAGRKAGQPRTDKTAYADKAKNQEVTDCDPETGEVIDDGEPFNPDDWLDSLESQMAVCQDADTLSEVWNTEAQPLIEDGTVFPPDRDKANELYEKHMDRVEKGEQD